MIRHRKTQVINIRASGVKCDVFIGRGSKWGNPFIIGRNGNREDVIARYERYLRNKPELLSRLHELEGKTLGCFCKPKACHGDILVKLLKEQRDGEKV